jgi:hypothetical protein
MDCPPKVRQLEFRQFAGKGEMQMGRKYVKYAAEVSGRRRLAEVSRAGYSRFLQPRYAG